MKKIFHRNEFVLFVIILVIYICFGLINPKIFSVGKLFDVARVGIVNFIFALSVLVVMIAGGIDISFMAIGSLAMYMVVKFVHGHNLNPPILVIFAAAIIIGILLGMVNAFFVDKIKLAPFIVTLGTQILFKGFLLTVIGTAFIVGLPGNMVKLGNANIVSVNEYGRTSALNVTFLLVLALYIGMFLLLKYTMIGRSIYALGGDSTAATRVGLNLTKIHCFVFGLAGALAAIGGITETVLTRQAIPGALIGNELNIIAAVVLGGGNDRTGEGSVLGTFLGMFLLTFVGNSLTSLRVPAYWQQAVSGLIIIIGVGLQARRKTENASVAA
jgi:simple sugar transport system permease protein